MTLLVFASRTSNIRKIVDKLNLPSDRVLDISSLENSLVIVKEKFYLLTYTDLLGSIPEIVQIFLDRNSEYLIGVAGSGNRNFGNNFCGAAKRISQIYKVPLLATFELSGNPKSIEEFKNFFLL